MFWQLHELNCPQAATYLQPAALPACRRTRPMAIFPACRGTFLQIPIASLPLRPDDRLQCPACRLLAVECLDELLAMGADPAPVPDQANRAEQVPLDHQ